ncbi:hypothetical protein D7X96_34470 [Corallococcus interemptor]|uniref:HEAT repeat domain-containing protein n=1 Tax=Corallococcus interemptor TaxID=2316720 RepID=A0A3A8PY44_9BACT|nr:hypothetical protein [Corallococcus interemptor]RKH59921.1 hypothetical protein D7X96_34470 [Corallococcus interemptor]
MSPVRIVLKEQSSRERVEVFAWRDGWSMWDVFEASGLEPYTKIYRTMDDQTEAYYFEDQMVDFHYFVVTGADVEGTVQRIRGGLPCYTRDEVLQLVKDAKEPLELARAVRIAGVAAPAEFDPDIFEILRNAMSNPDTRVRNSAAAASAFAAWRELREPLERLSADSEPRVAEIAQVVLRGLKEKNWKES